MGYWLHYDEERGIVYAHKDTSPHHRCRWLGMKAGRPQPKHWVYYEQLTEEVLFFEGVRFRIKPCDLAGCLHGRWG